RPAMFLRACFFLLVCLPASALAQPTSRSDTYKRVKANLDGVAAIATHDHLWPFEKLPALVETERGKGVNLASIWRNSYYTWINPLTPWKPGQKFDDWWAVARNDFAN